MTGTDPAQEVDYKKLYEVLKAEDALSKELLAIANDQIEVLKQEVATVTKKYKQTFKKLYELNNKLV